MANAIRIRARMKEKSEQMDKAELEERIVAMMENGLKRADIVRETGASPEEVYKITRMYRVEVSKGSGGMGKAVRIKGLV